MIEVAILVIFGFVFFAMGVTVGCGRISCGYKPPPEIKMSRRERKAVAWLNRPLPELPYQPTESDWREACREKYGEFLTVGQCELLSRYLSDEWELQHVEESLDARLGLRPGDIGSAQRDA